MIRILVQRLSVPLCVLNVAMGFGVASVGAHSDVFLANVGGQVGVGGANDLATIDETFDIDTRVFEGVMIPGFPPINPADYGRDEPGFFALPSGDPAFPVGASALPASALVTINPSTFSVGGPSDTLFYWNGVGGVKFQPISIAQPSVAMSVDSNPIDSTGPNSGLDAHPAFMLDNGGVGVPGDGVYLISPTATVAGLSNSDNFYMVFLVDALLVDEDAAEQLDGALEMGQTTVFGKDFAFFEEAVDYVNQRVVPEPASLLLSVLALTSLVAIGARHRKG